MLTGPSIVVFIHESSFLCIRLKYVALLLLIHCEIFFLYTSIGVIYALAFNSLLISFFPSLQFLAE